MSAPKDQRGAVEFVLEQTAIPDGRTLIEASAGTGKTYTIAGLLIRLIAEEELRVGQILVVTFTEAATAELRSRIRAALRDALAAVESDTAPEQPLHARLWRDPQQRGGYASRLRRALREFDDAAISTIHGFCLRVLENAALQAAVPFQLELLADDAPLLRRAVEDWWRRRVQSGSRRVVDTVRAAGWDIDALASLYADLRRNPGAEILPPAPDSLEAAESAVDAAALREAFEDPELPSALGAVSWKGPGMPLGASDVDGLLAAIRSRLEAGRCIEVANAFGPKSVESRVGKRGKAQQQARAALLERRFLSASAALEAAAGRLRSALRADLHAMVARDFRGEMQRAESLGFDDLLRTVRDALQAPGGGPRLRAHLAQTHPCVLVDEFQDTDTVQWEIFRSAFGDGRLFLIGDPKQSIYGFRGADLHTYLDARASCAERFTLTHNYRSRQQLLDGLNELFDRHDPFLVADLGYPRVSSGRGPAADRLRDPGREGSLVWMWAEKPTGRSNKPLLEAACATATVREIRRLLDAAKLCADGTDEDSAAALRARDIGILVRRNAEAQLLRDALAEAGIPAALGKGKHIRDSDEMGELRLLAAALASPRNRRAVRGAFLTLLWGHTRQDLERLEEPGQETELEEWIGFLEHCRQLWLRHGFVRALDAVLQRRGSRERLARLTQGERRLTNLQQSIEAVHTLALRRGLSPTALVEALRDPRTFEELEGNQTEMRLETDRDAVQILTMHRSKGLQFPVVFCPFLWDGRTAKRNTPVLRWHDDRGWHLRLQAETEEVEGADAGARAAHDAAELADALRLAYVALTRAEQRVYAFAPMHAGFANSPLGYLLRPDASEPGAAGPADRAAAAAASWNSVGTPEGVLASLRNRAPQAITLVEFDATDDAPVSGDRQIDEDATTWSAGPLPDEAAPRLQPWWTTSFTGLVRGAMDPASDEAGATDPSDRADPATPAEPLADATADPATEPLLGFARGAAAGTCLHQVLERIDLRQPDADGVATVIDEELRRARLDDPRRHPLRIDPHAAVHQMVARVATAPLPESFGCGADRQPRQLCALPPRRDLPEWRFHLQMAAQGDPEDDFADLFARHGGELARRYAERLRLLLPARRGTALRGYLTGSIDLVLAFDDDRHWVIDWKSNHLGPRRADHQGAALEAAMFEHHYVLQYHLYVLALHRHLRARRPTDYEYDRHIGGAAYAFVRGLGPDGGGWFVDRPPRGLIEALDRFFGSREGRRP